MKATHGSRSTTFAPMLAKCLCAGLAALLSQPLLAQTGYPAKPIRIVSPLATGGTNDYLAHMVGRVLTDAALDVISGQIDFMFANMSSVLGIVRTGSQT